LRSAVVNIAGMSRGDRALRRGTTVALLGGMSFVELSAHEIVAVVGGDQPQPPPSLADEAASLAGQFAKMRALPGCVEAAERAQDQSVLKSCLAKAADEVANPIRARVNKIPVAP
jgi:hypothetical protein